MGFLAEERNKIEDPSATARIIQQGGHNMRKRGNRLLGRSQKEMADMTEPERVEYVDQVFAHYRQNGFPYFTTNWKARQRAFKTFMNFDDSIVIKKDKIRQCMLGLALAWSYFPHSWGVRCNGMRTSMEMFNDDALLRKFIHRMVDANWTVSDATVRIFSRIFTGNQGVSNFRPTAASAIYKRYGGMNNVVWDMSGGFGGRLLGSMKANVKCYIATDPSTKTFEGLNGIAEDFGENLVSMVGESSTKLLKMGSEEFLPDKESLDLCFTSPPYFNTEKYSDEGTQSCNKFQEQEQWRIGFLRKTFENCWYGLKPGKLMIININNTKTYPTLNDDTIRTAAEVGFVLDHQIKLCLSSMTTSKELVKYEPVFVFKKPT